MSGGSNGGIRMNEGQKEGKGSLAGWGEGRGKSLRRLRRLHRLGGRGEARVWNNRDEPNFRVCGPRTSTCFNPRNLRNPPNPRN